MEDNSHPQDISGNQVPAVAPSQPAPDKNSFALWKVLLPVAIGLGVVVMMFRHELKGENFDQLWDKIQFTPLAIFCIFLGVVCMGFRDLGLTWRFRALTDRKLSWKSAWTVDMMCEFTNCITPSAVGGSSLGPVFLNAEGIEFGRATTLMLTTLFMDELFFVVSCPFVVLFTPSAEIFNSGGTDFTHGIKYTFWVVYSIIAAWTFLLFLGIIWKPYWIQKTLNRIAGWKILRKWKGSILGLSSNMIATAQELRLKPFRFWLEVFCGTALAWTARYFVVNALFLGFLPGSDPHQWIILARQFVIWVVLMVSPTPGGAGLSEWLFSNYYGDLITVAGMALVMAVFWRLITYYLYLLIGVCVTPSWLRKYYATIHARKETKDQAPSEVQTKTTT
ncbi:MAG: flippase-like domain-containing protein [Muribaculaceae bacterium]|nr:flippase-like domain-containing protein [Muribaculaceae bacterium]